MPRVLSRRLQIRLLGLTAVLISVSLASTAQTQSDKRGQTSSATQDQAAPPSQDKSGNATATRDKNGNAVNTTNSNTAGENTTQASNQPAGRIESPSTNSGSNKYGLLGLLGLFGLFGLRRGRPVAAMERVRDVNRRAA